MILRRAKADLIAVRIGYPAMRVWLYGGARIYQTRSAGPI